MTELNQFIFNCLSTYYLIEAATLAQLYLGADLNASIYEVQAEDQKSYFVKLKRDHSHDANIEILELLRKAGVQQLIHPIKTVEGKQMHRSGDFTIIVYPFIRGEDGFSRSLTGDQWIALGRALKQVHQCEVPASLESHIRREEFSPKWRDIVRSLFNNIETVFIEDEIALNLWNFLRNNKPTIQKLIDTSDLLCQTICKKPPEYVLCHSDIHGGNVLIAGPEAFYIVDWDDPIMAPKERDLMFIGGGVGNVWNMPSEEKLFYQGYGTTDLDWTTLAYYRYERIVEDIAVYCQELLLKPMQGNNREEMYRHFMNMFEPNGVVEIAFATDGDQRNKARNER